MGENIVSIIVRARSQGVAATAAEVSGALQRVRARTEGLRAAQAELAATSARMMAGGAALGAGVAALARDAALPEQELRNVNTIAKLNESQLGALRQEIRGIAADEGHLADRMQVTSAVYDVMSVKGYNAAAATDIVRQATTLATAGQEDLTAATEMTMDVLTSYGRTAPGAAKRVTDELYEAVQVGRFRLPELQGQIGPPMQIAASLGIDESEILAALAVMSNKGFEVAEAATAIERTMTSALKPSKEFTAAAREMGYESATAMARAEGLAGVLRLVETATRGDEEALAGIFPNVRALRGALALTGESAAYFRDTLQDIRNSAGAAAAAAAEQQRGELFQWQAALKGIREAGRDLGVELFPALTALTRHVRDAVKAFRDMSPEERRRIVNAAAWTAGLLVTVGALGKLTNGVLTILRLRSEWGAFWKTMGSSAAAASTEAAATERSTAAHARHANAANADAAANRNVAASLRESAAAQTEGTVAGAGGVVPGGGRGRAAATATAASEAGTLADMTGTRRNFAAEEAALDAEFNRRNAAARGERLEWMSESRRNMRRELRGVADRGAARGTPAFRAFGAEATDEIAAARRAAQRAELKNMGASMAGMPLDVADWRAGFAARGAGAAANATRAGNAARAAANLGRLESAAGRAAGLLGKVGAGVTALPGTLATLGTNLGQAAVSGLAAAGPLLAVAAAAGVAAYALHKTGSMAMQWWQAREQAKQGKQNLAAAEQQQAGQGRTGAWNFEMAARHMGANEEHIQWLERNMDRENLPQTYKDEIAQIEAARRQHNTAAAKARRAAGTTPGQVSENARFEAWRAQEIERSRSWWDPNYRQQEATPTAASDLKEFRAQIKDMSESELGSMAASQQALARGHVDVLGKEFERRGWAKVPTGKPGMQGYAAAGMSPVSVPVARYTPIGGAPVASPARGGSTQNVYQGFLQVGTFNDLQAMMRAMERKLNSEFGVSPA